MSDLSSRAYVRDMVRRRGLHLSRKRGQNFLVDSSYLDRIKEAASLGPSDRVLEIGAGFGTLTEVLADEAGWVAAIELDSGVFEVLEQHLGDRSNVRLIHGDALRLNLGVILEELPQPESTCVHWHAPKVVANLPYNITSPLLAHLLEGVHPTHPLERIVVMVQRELADRISADPGTKDYSSFSVLVQYYAEPHVFTYVPRQAFFPTPNVDSAILVLRLRSVPAVHVKDEQLFFRVVRAAFSQRRKTLANALSANPSLELEKQGMIQVLEKTGIDPMTRGEQLSLAEFGALANTLYERLGG